MLKITKEREKRIDRHQCSRKHPCFVGDPEAFACFVCDLLEEIDAMNDQIIGIFKGSI